MKKLYFLLPFLALASCSTVEEDTSAFDNPVLVTKMVQHGDIITFSYSGKKITEMNNTTDNSKRVFTYTGDVITEYVDTFSDGTTATTLLTYNSNEKITKKTTTASGATMKTTYVYLAGGDKIQIITETTKPGYSSTSVKIAYTNPNGSLKNWEENITKTESGGTEEGTGVLKTIVYDGGSFPFKNITGYTKMLESGDMNGSGRNVLEYNDIITYPSKVEHTIYKSTYEYHTNGYPKKDIRDYYDQNGLATSSTITTYEYNHL